MKKIKMVLYGEPGVGKSVFACNAPKPYFICTDPNYEWLEDWGAKEEDHIQIYSWEQAKAEFSKDFKDYETIVVDLTEDLFKWCEYEWCAKNGLVHVADLGYGKGYDVTRNEFFIEMCKLLNLPKNIILIMHGLTYTVKDRRGVEHTKFGPTTRIPDKVIDMIEGRVRYFVRAFANTEEDGNGDLVVKRYLSLSPDGTTEFGITRGLNANAPKVIPLDWATFQEVVEQYSPKAGEIQTIRKEQVETVEAKPVETKRTSRSAKSSEEKDISETLKKLKKTVESTPDPVKEEKTEEPKEEIKPLDHLIEDLPKVETVKEEPKVEVVKEEPVQEAPAKAPEKVDNTDKIASIKAKLAALKSNK